MSNITLLQLRNSCKERSNMENSTFVSDAEWTRYINYSISELRDIIISKVGNDYYALSQSYTIATGTDTYALPADFYKVLWVELLGEDGYYYKMKRFEVTERNQGRSPLNYFISDVKYRLRADNITISPNSLSAGRVIRLWYVPLITYLVADGDVLNGFNGWDEFVVLKSARKALVKEESDTSQVDQELAVLYGRLEAMAENRDQSEPMRIYDNETNYYGPLFT